MALDTPFDAPPAAGEAVALAPGVLWLRMPLPFGPRHVNLYALDDGDGWTLVDSGADHPACRQAWAALQAGPLAGKPLRRIVATHHHLDHIGLAGWLMATEGAALLTSRTAWLMARMMQLDVQEEATPEQLAFWRRAGMPPELLRRRARERPFNTADAVHPLPLGYRRLVEGASLHAGGRDWRVAMGNGHAPEHVTLWSDDGRLVIGGDQLLGKISPNLGVYATEPDADPVGDWLESCARLRKRATGAELVLPGHGLPYRGLPARLDALIAEHQEALDRLARALAETPRTAVGCFDLLYRRRLTEGEFGLGLVEAVGHINRLRLDGRARAVGETPEGATLWGG